jgi:ferrochelatase
VADAADLDRWSIGFQSESPSGEPWLEPHILAELERLHADGVKRVLVAPVGFVSDHLEILWDLDIEAREKATELGMALDRMPSLNDDPAFIRVLAGVVSQQPAYPPYVPAP